MGLTLPSKQRLEHAPCFFTKQVHRHKRTNSGTSNKLCVEHDGGTKEQRAEDPKVQAPLGVVDCK